MSATSVLRSFSRQFSSSCRRHSSSTSQTIQPTLPADKMRSIISLYHQSKDFITLEDLDARIDAAFIDDMDFTKRNDMEWTTLNDQLHRRRDKRFGSPTARKRWSPSPTDEPVTERDSRTSAALHGLDPSGLPGLEVVQEEHARIHEWVQGKAKQ